MSSLAPARQPGSGSSSIIQRLLGILSDTRFLSALGQLIFLVVIVYLLVSVNNNITSTLAQRNITTSFNFLQDRAGFAIGGARDYSPDDPYLSAYLVGLRNTLLTSSVGLFGATVLGILGGILLLSTNWLLRNITRFIVEVLRNSPILVVIYVMFVVVLALPPLNNTITFPNAGLLPIPLRFLIYAVGVVYILYSTRSHRDPLHRSASWAALAGFVIALEILFALDARRPLGDPAIYGSGLSAGAWLYLVVTGLAVMIVASTPQALATILNTIAPRPVLLWLLAGQLAAVLLFLFGIIPNSAIIAETQPAFYLNNRGLTFPETVPTARFGLWMAFVAIGIGFGVAAFLYLRRVTETTGKPTPRVRMGLLILAAFAIFGWIVVSAQPTQATVPVMRDGEIVTLPLETARAEGLLTRADELAYASTPIDVRLPLRQGLRFSAGETLTPEYVALTAALIIYTAAFIAEIVRAGILAVPHGQVEAARALGLSNAQLLRMVILPQALRVIIPPLSNQYLNLAKNSSLAIAISYADTYQVMNTVINQSGQAVSGIILIMLTYLVISLSIAAVMNVVNSRFQLVTR
jgi:general L-amino acid transport system permease protein